MIVNKKDFKRVTVRFSPEEYEEIASLAREGTRGLPQQIRFMSKTWFPLALKLCKLYEFGTPDGWAVHFWEEYRQEKSLSKTLRIITDHEHSLDNQVKPTA